MTPRTPNAAAPDRALTLKNPAAVFAILEHGTYRQKCSVTACAADADLRSRCGLCNTPVYCAEHHRRCTGCGATSCAGCTLAHPRCWAENCYKCCDNAADAVACLFCQALFCADHAPLLAPCSGCGAARCPHCQHVGRGTSGCGPCSENHEWEAYYLQWEECR